MSRRSLEMIGVASAMMAVVLSLQLGAVRVAAQAPTSRATTGTAAKAADPAPKTAWGDPDLQGIWTFEKQIPLQRPTAYAGREFFTDEEIAQLDKERAKLQQRDARGERGSEADVLGAYGSVFNNYKYTGRRTSLIVDPPDGRMPPLTVEAQKRMAIEREYRVALLQATIACKDQQPGCAGGTYGPPSPRRAETPPAYIDGFNRSDNPEDRPLSERCLLGVLPDYGTGYDTFGGSYKQIVQSPGQVSMHYDAYQGQGFQRVIPITTAPHLPSRIRQWWGDSRGRWEGNTLVVDVTNFTAKNSYQSARENLHLIERWTRTGPNTIELVATLDDPTTWTKPWTIKQEWTKQDDQRNRIYYEPRCHEGNHGLAGLLIGGRADDTAFAEGRGPDPATKCTGFGCLQGPAEARDDPLNR